MKKIKYVFLGLAVVLMSTSCKKFLDINEDPDAPLAVPAELTIPSAEAQVAGSLSGDFGILGGLWAQHFAQSNASSQYKDEESYNLNSSDYNRPWRDLYTDCFIDLAKAKADGASKGEWTSYLISTAVTAFAMQILVDYYDQAPFSEALGGENSVYTPAFEPGADIYDALFAQIDEAAAKDFDGSGVKKVSTDYIFGSQDKEIQIASWKAFANTLKMKMYLRQWNVRTGASTTGLNNLYNAYNGDPLTLLANQDAAITQFEDKPGKSNPMYETDQRNLNTKDNLRANNTLISYMIEAGDARIDNFYVKPSGPHKGLPSGGYDFLTTAPWVPTTISKVRIEATTPFFFFSIEEVNFMLAETALKLGKGASEVKEHYDNAVMAAFERYALDGTTYIESGGIYEFPEGGTSEDQLKAIMTQKWMSYFNRGYEAYFDFMRTGYPEVSGVPFDDAGYEPGQLTYPITGVTSDIFPNRLIFPDIEKQSNPNTPAVVPLTTPVWWQGE